MIPKRLVYGTAAALLVAVGLLAASTAFAQQQPPVAISAAQALTAALTAVPGTVLELELEHEAGRATYEVSIRPQAGGPVRELVLDGSTGAVLSNTVDDDAGEAAGAPVAVAATQALTAALGAVQGTVLKLELEDEGGRLAYEVEIRPQTGGPVREVLVDASTGAVLGARTDEDAGETAGADD